MPVLAFFVLAIGLALLAGHGAAEDGDGTLRGVITIVGQDTLSGGEVVVSYAGTSTAAGTASFDSEDPEYSVGLPPGEYDVYAWAKVFHNSPVETVTIEANGTTWSNLTVVRIEEVIGTTNSTSGEALGNVVVELYANGSLVKAIQSDDEGRFRDLVDPGTYNVTATKAGYLEEAVQISVDPGEVVRLDIVMEPEPEDPVAEEFPMAIAAAGAFILVVGWVSVSYMRFQARRLRRAKAQAEAMSTRDWECPDCGAHVPESSNRCSHCGHIYQVRCDECGRSVDAGKVECPECGTVMSGDS